MYFVENFAQYHVFYLYYYYTFAAIIFIIPSNTFKEQTKMTSRDFCYWLQGFFEIQDPNIITQKQKQCIKKHLALVFKHEIDPSMGDDKHQKELNEIHSTSNSINNDNEVYRC